MECLLQYLDDIDDLVGAIGLLIEPIRRVLLAFAATFLAITSVAGGVLLASVHPPGALATCLLLLLALVRRSSSVLPRDGTHIA